MSWRDWISVAEGHLWTVAPLAVWRLLPESLSPARAWRATIDDARVGRIGLSGALHDQGSDTALVVVHGLGGDIDSHYVQRAAIAAARAGIDCLRLNLRGADLSGEDFYHAGLVEDLVAAVGSVELARHRRIVLLGYSLGGHLVLRYAAARPDARVTAVAAVCPPLDLARAVRDMDARARWPYRRHVLAALKQMLPASRALPVPLEVALRIQRLREWDERLVVPRFGFSDVDHYYRDESAMHYLDELRVPALVVATKHDPMVLAQSVAPALARQEKSARVTVRWLERAGHVGFPPRTRLGVAHGAAGSAARPGLESQAVAWLLAPEKALERSPSML